MDIFFADPNEIPLPPQEVRIRLLRAEPWPDGKRVRVFIEVDPFQKRPNLDLRIMEADGSEAATVTIIESMTRKIELTMHLRRVSSGPFTLSATLFFPPQVEPSSEEGGEPPMAKIEPVDRMETTFAGATPGD